jgi:hypothetical protein
MFYALCFSILLLFLLLFIIKKEPAAIVESMEDKSSLTSSSQCSSYQKYDDNNPMMLAQKNAANIQFLEERIKSLHDIQNQVESNKKAISQMAQLASKHLTQTSGVTPATATPSALKKVSSIGSSPGNVISPTTAPVTDVTPAKPLPL